MIKRYFPSAPISLLLLVCLNGYTQVAYTPLYTNSNFSRVIDLRKPVGTINGNPGTTASGAAMYSVPIYCPPGSNGLQPNISISYSSQAGNGLLGWGWNISGLSMISRGGKTLYHDGIIQPTTLTDEDGFYLNGVRFYPLSGPNGGNFTEYGCESEEYSKIISYSTNPNNPIWFEVISKDGTKIEFGNTNDSRILTDNEQNVLIWRVNRILDINGNYIDFNYVSQHRDNRINTIRYTGNINTQLIPYNKLQFHYEERNDINTTFEAGSSLTSKYLLTKISISTMEDDPPEIVFKTYNFNYGTDDVHSYLKEIVESIEGEDIFTSLNSTIFLYGSRSGINMSEDSYNIPSNSDIITGDFNADGISDVLAATFTYDDFFKVHQSYSIVLGSQVTTPQNILYLTNLIGTAQLSPGAKSQFNFLTGDFTSDGRDDVLYFSGEFRKDDNAFILSKVYLNKTTTGQPVSIDFNMPEHLGTPFGWTNADEKYSVTGDFDGDGNQDYILFLENHAFGIYKAFFTSPATGETNIEIDDFGVGPVIDPLRYAKTVAESSKVIPLDFNGDGNTEIMVTHLGVTYILSINRINGTAFQCSSIATTMDIYDYCTVYLGDFNGDKKADILSHNDYDEWKIFYSTGTSFDGRNISFQHPVQTNSQFEVIDKILVSDFNGDGLSDILHCYNYGLTESKQCFYISKGLASLPQFHYEEYIHNRTIPYPDLIAADFNGDGQSDFISRYAFITEYKKIMPNSKERLLNKIMDGYNNICSFQYDLLTNQFSNPVYTRTISPDNALNTAPFNYVQVPLYVVSEVNSPDGAGGITSSTFNYENALVHRTGKGFLGFLKTKCFDYTNLKFITSEFELNNQFALLLPRKSLAKHIWTNMNLLETETTNSVLDISVGGKPRYKIEVVELIEKDHLNKRGSKSINVYDSYGNVVNSTLDKGYISNSSIVPIETVNTSTIYGIHNTPVPAKPDLITVTKQRNGSSSINFVKSLNYNSIGLVTNEINFAGLPNAISTNSYYNQFGNVIQLVTSAPGVNNRQIDFTYDTKGRFCVKKEFYEPNSWNQKNLKEWDGKWGAPLSETTSDCLTSYFQYDGFGRLITTTVPDGYDINYSLHWDIQGEQISYTYIDYPGGSPDKKVWNDKQGRVIRSQEMGLNNQWVTQVITFDYRGNIESTTNKYYPSEQPLTTFYSFDDYNRPIGTSNNLSSNTISYSLHNNNQEVKVTTTNSANQVSSQITDGIGKIILVEDNGGQISYDYDSWGNQITANQSGVPLITTSYDQYGRKIFQMDVNLGTIQYGYNAYGELISESEIGPNNTQLNRTFIYDDLGRLISKTGNEGTTTYEYFGKFACPTNRLRRITAFNGTIKEFTYDSKQRLTIEKTTVDGVDYVKNYTYDFYGNNTQILYPSGIEINKNYDNDGNIVSIYGGESWNQRLIASVNNENGIGQVTSFICGNGKVSTLTFNYGIPQRFFTPGTQDLNFSFDNATANLLSRYDAISGNNESFTYDQLNRFVKNTVNGVDKIVIGYDLGSGNSLGNIISKTDAGDYTYLTNKAHAVAYITNPAGQQAPPITISSTEQQIVYTPFHKPAVITEGGYSTQFTYGPSYERIKTETSFNGATYEWKYYLGDYERIMESNGNSKYIHSVSIGNVVAVVEKPNTGVSTINFIYTDYLGSLLTKTDELGQTTNEQNFDAWGRFRNPVNWEYSGATITEDFYHRGFTGHEHMKDYDLINMNGRLYDPIQSRMLSPDNFINSDFGTQSFNRYSYAYNNPLSFTDPDGNHPAIIIAAIIGAYTGGSMANGSLNPFNWTWNGTTLGYMFAGAVVGAFSAWTGALISEMIGTGTQLATGAAGFLATTVGSGVSGFISGFGYSAMSGNDPILGAFRGGITSTAGAAVGSMMQGEVGAIVSGTFNGVVSSAVSGGDLGDILESGAMGGASNWITFKVESAIYYQKVKKMVAQAGADFISRKQFNEMGKLIQKSYVFGNEQGGWFRENELDPWTVVPNTNTVEPTPKKGGERSSFHTHRNIKGLIEGHSPDFIDLSGRYHPNDIGADKAAKMNSYVISWRNVYFHDWKKSGYSFVQKRIIGPAIIGSSLNFNPYPVYPNYFYPRR